MGNPLLIAVIIGWVMSVCVHEYCHALAAYLAGDRSVSARGYLSMNPLLYIDPQVERDQVAALARLRATRDNDLVKRRLAALTAASRDERQPLMPHLLDCARAYATKGEMRKAMGEVFGEHREAPEF